MKKSEDSRDAEDRSGSSSAGASYSAQNQNSYVFGYQISTSDSTAKNIQKSESISQGVSKNFSSMLNKSSSDSISKTETENFSLIEQAEVETKTATQWLKYIDEILLPRLDCGRGKGIFLYCACLFAEQPAIL